MPRPAVLLTAVILLAAPVIGSDPPSAAAPPAGWVKDRLAAVDKVLDAEAADLVRLYQHLHANP